MNRSELSFDMILEAQKVLTGKIETTTVLPAPGQDEPAYIKAENMQFTGSFKIRGAYYKMSKLTKLERERGVITCSAGNFAQGVAYAAREHGIHATICVPSGASPAKVEATKALGAEVVFMPGNYYEDAFRGAVALGEERGMTFLHAFEDPLVIAGAGTIGLEILEQVPNLDFVLAPIGGGGLLSGIAFAIKQRRPSCKLIGVQLTEAPCMFESRRLGKVITLDEVKPTFADGMAGRKPGDYTFQLCNKYVDDIVLVSSDEVAQALLTLLSKKKILTEGAGASAYAAVLFDKVDVRGKRAVCVASGGNIDLGVVERLITAHKK